MRILLYGEFSSFHSNLKIGLQEIGHEVVLVSDGDGFKNISSDFAVSSKRKGLFRQLDLSVKHLKLSQKMGKFDIIQIINPNFIPFLVFNKVLRTLSNKNTKIFLSACGDDVQYIKYINQMRYSPYSNSNKPYTRLIDKLRNFVTLNKVNGIIPVMYDYAEPYRESKYKNKLLPTIPLPITINHCNKKRNNKKIIIFHGLNRESFKGTKYIIEAMNKIKLKYMDLVQLEVHGKLSLNEYLEKLEIADIVIDQALSYSYGMNALYAMRNGSVVLSGNEHECMCEFKTDVIPVINILPSSDDIYTKLEELILNQSYIVELGIKSKEFVEIFHNSIFIAKKYISVWKI